MSRNFNRSAYYAGMWTIDDDGSSVPAKDRHLVMPDGLDVYYPEDMWPPVPGQRCRPQVFKNDKKVPLTGGLLAAYYPMGIEREEEQRSKASDLGIEFKPQIRSFAAQLASQGLVELTPAEQAHFHGVATEA